MKTENYINIMLFSLNVSIESVRIEKTSVMVIGGKKHFWKW